MISESVLPSKSQLIKICREQDKLDHSKLGISGIQILKDRVIIAIFIAEILRQNTVSAAEENNALGAFKECLGSRSALLAELETYESKDDLK